MKSLEQNLLTLAECVLMDAAAKCSVDNLNVFRDLQTMKRRIEHEGISFFTITLPNFGSDFERSLESKFVDSHVFQGWKKRGHLPAFLQGFVSLVFNVDTGEILNEESIPAIEGVRQIAYSFKKLGLPCNPKREAKAIRSFREVERTLSTSMCCRYLDLFDQVTRILCCDVFANLYDSDDLIPKHGPGQTAEHISGNRKYSHRTWYERLEPFFPASSYLMTGINQCIDEEDGLDQVNFVPEEQELPVRIVLVPKTLKGPRIIAIEPVCMQYAQQALSSYIIKRIETSKFTSGHVNFTDQSVNQKLAISASSDGSYSTIDLSEASDRVPLSLVTRMLDCNPDYRDAILACRSKAAQMPDGEIIHLKKFASMGSALCFPIESLYFFSAIVAIRCGIHKLPVTSRNVFLMSRDVYVYGDDIIVPTDETEAIANALTEFNCKVNTTKSFWKGYFRESCGMDAYKGEEVTPTYLRKMQPSNRRSTAELISWVATSNQFYLKGYWNTSNYMKNVVEKILGKLPIVMDTSPGLGWLSFQRGYSKERWNKRLHRYEVFTYVLSPVYRKDPLDGWSALLKFFLPNSKASVKEIDKKHLQRTSRSGTVSMKRRWTPPY